MAGYKAPKNGQMRMRDDPMDLFKQLAVTFAGLLIVSATILAVIYTQGDEIHVEIERNDGGEMADKPAEAPAEPAPEEADEPLLNLTLPAP